MNFSCRVFSLKKNTQMDKQHVQDAFQKHVFFPIIIEGPWIHQSGPATVSSGQFRVRVVHTSHHSITVHREPEQQLHITSSLSSTPHNQPQHAVVKFQWMVRVNIFDKKKKRGKKKREKKDCSIKKKERERLLGIKDFIKSASETWTEKTREAQTIN